MKLDYYYCDPTGNITLIVTSPLPRSEYKQIAEYLMKSEPTAEQVGFLEFDNDKYHLQMAGGEFCGNATMSAGCVIFDILQKKNGWQNLTVSGAIDILNVIIDKNTDDSYDCSVNMPKCKNIETVKLNGNDYPMVNFDGISHIICENTLNIETAESIIGEKCKELKKAALGIMLISGTDLIPIVYVDKSETLFVESSCGSGTTAAGLYFANKYGKKCEMSFREPKGILSVVANENGEAILKGQTRIWKKSTAYR